LINPDRRTQTGLAALGCRFPLLKEPLVTRNDLQNALSFLSRMYVGKPDEERFLRTLAAIRKELEVMNIKSSSENAR